MLMFFQALAFAAMGFLGGFGGGSGSGYIHTEATQAGVSAFPNDGGGTIPGGNGGTNPGGSGGGNGGGG
jgi:hypothetical protein